jgi:hypothetical protein
MDKRLSSQHFAKVKYLGSRVKELDFPLCGNDRIETKNQQIVIF